jgi:aarF domain-containing kinase
VISRHPNQNAIMSAFSHTFSPLLRRSGTVPSWTCRACSRSRGQPAPQRSTFASRIQGERPFATRGDGARSVAKGPTGNTVGTNANGIANAAKPHPSPIEGAAGSNAKSAPKSKRRRRLLIAGGALSIGAAAITMNDDAKHAYTAMQRSYRVLETLVLNIKEYVHSLALWLFL